VGGVSKLGCKCGGLISNVESSSSTEGGLTRQEDFDRVFSHVSEQIASFLQAVCSGKRVRWIESRFLDVYPKDLPDDTIIYDIITATYVDASLSICERKACGRLYVQHHIGENKYLGFAPDDASCQAVLKSESNSDGEIAG